MQRHLVFALIFIALAGCGATGPSFVNPSIAEAYRQFDEDAVSNPESARSALKRAQEADPKNGYTLYLRAALELRSNDLDRALKTLEEANALPSVVVYVSAPPPEDSISTLTRIRQIGFATERVEMLKDEQPRFFMNVRVMGQRVASSEPVNALSVLNGVGVIRKAWESEAKYWATKADLKRRDAALKEAKTLGSWYDGFTKTLAVTLKDNMREAGKEAGLTEEELTQYSKGQPLADQEKQNRADMARQKLYEAEVAALRKGLESLPKGRELP